MIKTSVSDNLVIDIYCPIIDNLGDIGKAYRLAKFLVKHTSWTVHFWPTKPIHQPPLHLSDRLILKKLDSHTPVGDIVITICSDWPPSTFLRDRPVLDFGYCLNVKKGGIEHWNNKRTRIIPGIELGFLLSELPLPQVEPNSVFWYTYRRDVDPNLVTELAYSSNVTKFTHQLSYLPSLGNFESIKLPISEQDDFDRAMFSSEVIFARGEDSFIQAMSSGQMTFWDPYPGYLPTSRITMVENFAELYTASWSDLHQQAYLDVSQAFITGKSISPWELIKEMYVDNIPALTAWRSRLLTKPNLGFIIIDELINLL